MVTVILLRAPSQDPDRYEESFRSAGYRVASVPVLETALTNLDELKQIMKHQPSTQTYQGVIVTSARACEAWKAAVKALSADSSGEVSEPADWSSVPFYAVGKATASSLAEIRDAYGDSRFVPRDIRGGAESGTSERLAHFILEDFAKQGDASLTLLYLTGDKNRDTLRNVLKEGGFELEPLKVYETQGSSSFASDLEHVVRSAPTGLDGWWIVFFAPSAAEFVLPTLAKFFDLQAPGSNGSAGAHVAAIGQTTAAFLRDHLNTCVDVVPPKPTPEDMVAAIVQYDERNRPANALLYR